MYAFSLCLCTRPRCQPIGGAVMTSVDRAIAYLRDTWLSEAETDSPWWLSPNTAALRRWVADWQSLDDDVADWSDNDLIDAIEAAVWRLVGCGVFEVAFTSGFPVLRLTASGVSDEARNLPEAGQRIRERFDELNRMPYGAYLESPEWRARRAEHIRAAGNRCQLCNSDETPLHVHHRTYANRGRERFYDLVVLCPPCHRAFHESGRKVR